MTWEWKGGAVENIYCVSRATYSCQALIYASHFGCNWAIGLGSDRQLELQPDGGWMAKTGGPRSGAMGYEIS